MERKQLYELLQAKQARLEVLRGEVESLFKEVESLKLTASLLVEDAKESE